MKAAVWRHGSVGSSEHAGLRTKICNKMGHWSTLIHCFYALDTLTRPAVLKEVAVRTRGLASSVAKCHIDKEAGVFHQLDSRERNASFLSVGVLQVDVVGLALFRMPVGACLASNYIDTALGLSPTWMTSGWCSWS